MHESQKQAIRDQLTLGWGESYGLHAQWIGDQYGFQSNERRPTRYQLGYMSRTDTRAFFDGARTAIIHWLGSDIMHVAEGRWPGPDVDAVHFCPTWRAQGILSGLGIDARVVVHRPLHRVEQPLPPPAEERVAIYVPDSRREFFRYPLMLEVERALAQRGWTVEWVIPTYEQLVKQEIDMMGVMRRCGVLLRCPKHDAFSHMAAEFMLAGRTVLTTDECPFQIKVKPEVQDIVEKIDTPPYGSAPAYYRWLTDPERLFEKIAEAIQ